MNVISNRSLKKIFNLIKNIFSNSIGIKYFIDGLHFNANERRILEYNLHSDSNYTPIDVIAYGTSVRVNVELMWIYQDEDVVRIELENLSNEDINFNLQFKVLYIKNKFINIMNLN